MARDSFLLKFEKLSVDLSSNTAIYYIRDATFSSFGISYSELNRLSSELSQYFLKLFKKSRQYIGVRLSDRLWVSCLLLGIWKSGNAFAGIGCHFTQEEYLKFLERLKIKYIITDVETHNYNSSLAYEFQINNQKFFVWERQDQENLQFLHWDMCFGIMTSGSTGIPKVVQVPWNCILPNAEELKNIFEITSPDNIYQVSPYTFDPFFIDVFLAFTSGASITFTCEQMKFSYDDLIHILFLKENNDCFCNNKELEKINENSHFNCDIKLVKPVKITAMQSTPSLFFQWGKQNIENILLNSKLRVLILGGEKFPSDLLSYSTSVKLYNIYGITEISCWGFIKQVKNETSEVSIGKPLNNIIYKLIEDELYIGSKTRKCLVDDEENFNKHEVVFRNSGDIVKTINDELYYVSRTNQIIKKYGIKVDLSKIEKRFLDILNIDQCCCIFDDSCNKLVLFLVYNPPKNSGKDYFVLKADENLQAVILKLADIEKPDLLIEISTLPVNNNGKCDRRRLLSIARNLPKKLISEKNLKNKFREIWCDVLNLSNFESSSNFVELGGTSVLALQITTKLNDAGIETPTKFLPDLLNNGNFNSCLNNLMIRNVSDPELPAKKFRKENKFNLYIAWKFDLKKCIDAPPMVTDINGIYNAIVGSHSSSLASINVDGGIENWIVQLGDRIESGCCIHKFKSLGFIGCYDHFVYCISLINGSVNWKFETGDMIKSTPCLSTDLETIFVASYDTYLYRLKVNDGLLMEKIKISQKGIYSSGIVSDVLRNFYIGTLGGSCISLSQVTNKIVWKSQLSSPVFASPCLINKISHIEILFIEVLGRVHAYHADVGNKLWGYESNGNIYSSPSAINVNNQNYIIYGCHDRCLYCLQIDSEPILKHKLLLDSPIFAAPQTFQIANEKLIAVVSTKGIVYIINFDLGDILSNLQLKGEIFSTPYFHDNRLLVGCRDNYLYCLQLE